MESRCAVLWRWLQDHPGSVCASQEPLPGACGPGRNTEVTKERGEERLAHRALHKKEKKNHVGSNRHPMATCVVRHFLVRERPVCGLRGHPYTDDPAA